MEERTHYYTHEESAKRVCPMSVGAGMNNKVLIINGLEVGRPCLGMHCQGWRWEAVWNDDVEDYEYGERGYCGVIGE
jgi:hypothetical protein